jgi:cystathionine beta-lyase
MMKYNFDQVHDRRGGDSFKWNYYEPDVLPLWVADMDFPSPEPVVSALRERVEHGFYGYPLGLRNLPNEVPELRQVIVDRLDQLYGWKTQPQDILLLPGVIQGFNLACHAVVAPNEAILVQTPVYHHILHAAENTGRLHSEIELTRAGDGTYPFDDEAFERNLLPQTRLFILCNPHNPVGKAYLRGELERIAEICLRRSIVICADEIHCDLVYKGMRHVPIASISPEISGNTITLMAPSKTFNLAGLHFAFAVIQNRELRKRFLAASQGLVSWVNLMGLVAAQAAYKSGQEWLKQVMTYLETNREYLYTAIQADLPGIKMVRPQATYLAWLDCRQVGIEGNSYEFFLEKGRLALDDGERFGKGGEGFVRLNFACPRTILDDAIGRMKTAISQR